MFSVSIRVCRRSVPCSQMTVVDASSAASITVGFWYDSAAAMMGFARCDTRSERAAEARKAAAQTQGGQCAQTRKTEVRVHGRCARLSCLRSTHFEEIDANTTSLVDCIAAH